MLNAQHFPFTIRNSTFTIPPFKRIPADHRIRLEPRSPLATSRSPAGTPHAQPPLQFERRATTMASKYGKKTGAKVEKAMHERNSGTVKSGSTGKQEKSSKQTNAHV